MMKAKFRTVVIFVGVGGKFHQGNFKYIAYYINMFIIYKLVDIKYINI